MTLEVHNWTTFLKVGSSNPRRILILSSFYFLESNSLNNGHCLNGWIISLFSSLGTLTLTLTLSLPRDGIVWNGHSKRNAIEQHLSLEVIGVQMVLESNPGPLTIWQADVHAFILSLNSDRSFATAFGGLHSTATFNLMLSNSDSTLWVRASYQMLQKKSLGPTKPDFCTKTQLFGPTKCFDWHLQVITGD